MVILNKHIIHYILTYILLDYTVFTYLLTHSDMLVLKTHLQQTSTMLCLGTYLKVGTYLFAKCLHTLFCSTPGQRVLKGRGKTQSRS